VVTCNSLASLEKIECQENGLFWIVCSRICTRPASADSVQETLITMTAPKAAAVTAEWN
jgi:hypothetical protein